MNISKTQSVSLFLLRVFIGWHFFYVGLIKVLNPDWTSAGFLSQSKGVFSGMFQAIAENISMLHAVDFLNQWGLVIIGLGLMLGLFTRLFSILGMVLLLLYYLATPPFPGLEYNMATEGSYLVVNKNLIEAAALLLLSVFPSGEQYGFDLLLKKKTTKQ